MKNKLIFILVFLFLISLIPVSAQESNETVAVNETHKVCINYFYGQGCPHCAKLASYLDKLEEKYDDIEIKRYDTARNIQLFIDMQSRANISQEKWGWVPKILIGTDYCIGDDPCIDSLEDMIEKARDDGVCPIDGVENQLQKLTAIKLVSLAIADAFNPCELAVLLILLGAILTQYPRKRKKALSAGLLFTLAIYICYFVFGTLIILGFKSLTAITSFTTGWIYKGLGIFAIVL